MPSVLLRSMMALNLPSVDPGLGDLPESCIAAILGFTIPRDVARLACVSRTFRDASCSDLVWQRMLPPHYTDILARAPDAPPRSCSKKGVYDYLCNRVLLQNGTQEYWLDRSTGGVCRSIGARGLRISWGDDLRYWDWPTREGSRFSEVAYLKQVCWFDVQGELQCYLPPGTYTLSWRVVMGASPSRSRSHFLYAFDYVYGWTQKPVKFSFKATDNQLVDTEFYLTAEGREGRTLHEQAPGQQQPLGSRLGLDTWMEIDVGEFTVGTGDSPVELKFSMIEIDGGNWKTGLYLDGVVIRPTLVTLKEQSSNSHVTREASHSNGTMLADHVGDIGELIMRGEGHPVHARRWRPRRLLRRTR